jgi:hypothetical protein
VSFLITVGASDISAPDVIPANTFLVGNVPNPLLLKLNV